MRKISFNDYRRARDGDETLDEGVKSRIKGFFNTLGNFARDTVFGTANKIRQTATDFARDSNISTAQSDLVDVLTHLQTTVSKANEKMYDISREAIYSLEQARRDLTNQREKVLADLQQIELKGLEGDLMDPKDMQKMKEGDAIIKRAFDKKIKDLRELTGKIRSIVEENANWDTGVDAILQSVIDNLQGQKKFGKETWKSPTYDPITGGRGGARSPINPITFAGKLNRHA